MGDRFYEQQRKAKPKRRLKKDYIEELTILLDCEILGLDKLTIASLETLTSVIKERLNV